MYDDCGTRAGHRDGNVALMLIHMMVVMMMSVIMLAMLMRLILAATI